MKKRFLFILMITNALASGFSQTSSWTVNNTSSWIEAVNGIRSGGSNKEYTITVTGNVSVPAGNESTFGSVTGMTVTLGGTGSLAPSANGSLLCIGAGQTVIARDIKLHGRANNNAPVVIVERGGAFRMEGNASVTGNTANTNGGGVNVNGGTFIMVDNASVSGNTVIGEDRSGGGVYVNDRGTFTMQNNASVTNNNNATRFSIGLYGGGGGVYVSGTFSMRDNASVSGNTAPNCSGGGVYVTGSFTMQDSAAVTGNQNRGVYVGGGTFTMQGGSISNNTDSSSSDYNAFSSGGGVYIEGGNFIMQNGTITGNTASAVSAGRYSRDGTKALSYGGGVCLGKGSFTMRGGTITGNTANAANPGGDANSYGGGVYVGTFGYDTGNQTFIMEGGTISGNTSTSGGSGVLSYGSGGGVYAAPDHRGTVTMQGSASVSANTADGNGGGIFVANGRTFLMKDQASVSGNTAGLSGGGVYVERNGAFNMQGGASISGNTAPYGGGGVYNAGNLTKTGGIIHGDDAEPGLRNNALNRIGHAVYESGNGSWRNATAGLTMNSNSYGFLLNDGDVVIFPSDFTGTWKRINYDNNLTLTVNTIKSSSSDRLWILQSVTGNVYTFKRSDAANTLTITVRFDGDNLIISGDSGSGQDNWNGTWWLLWR
jgi:predicted outer membrane repeat protein